MIAKCRALDSRRRNWFQSKKNQSSQLFRCPCTPTIHRSSPSLPRGNEAVKGILSTMKTIIYSISQSKKAKSLSTSWKSLKSSTRAWFSHLTQAWKRLCKTMKVNCAKQSNGITGFIWLILRAITSYILTTGNTLIRNQNKSPKASASNTHLRQTSSQES